MSACNTVGYTHLSYILVGQDPIFQLSCEQYENYHRGGTKFNTPPYNLYDAEGISSIENLSYTIGVFSDLKCKNVKSSKIIIF